MQCRVFSTFLTRHPARPRCWHASGHWKHSLACRAPLSREFHAYEIEGLETHVFRPHPDLAIESRKSVCGSCRMTVLTLQRSRDHPWLAPLANPQRFSQDLCDFMGPAIRQTLASRIHLPTPSFPLRRAPGISGVERLAQWARGDATSRWNSSTGRMPAIARRISSRAEISNSGAKRSSYSPEMPLARDAPRRKSPARRARSQSLASRAPMLLPKETDGLQLDSPPCLRTASTKAFMSFESLRRSESSTPVATSTPHGDRSPTSSRAPATFSGLRPPAMMTS